MDVRMLRHRLGLTQAELAAQLNCSPSTVAQWEGGREPDGMALRLLQILEDQPHLFEHGSYTHSEVSARWFSRYAADEIERLERAQDGVTQTAIEMLELHALLDYRAQSRLINRDLDGTRTYWDVKVVCGLNRLVVHIPLKMAFHDGDNMAYLVQRHPDYDELLEVDGIGDAISEIMVRAVDEAIEKAFQLRGPKDEPF